MTTGYWVGWTGKQSQMFVGFLKKGFLRLDIYQCNLFLENVYPFLVEFTRISDLGKKPCCVADFLCL